MWRGRGLGRFLEGERAGGGSANVNGLRSVSGTTSWGGL